MYLRDIWPTDQEIEELVRTSVRTEFFDSEYKAALTANESWNNLEGAQGNLYAWEEKSTYIRKPPFVENMSAARPALQSPDGARVLPLAGRQVLLQIIFHRQETSLQNHRQEDICRNKV